MASNKYYGINNQHRLNANGVEDYVTWFPNSKFSIILKNIQCRTTPNQIKKSYLAAIKGSYFMLFSKTCEITDLISFRTVCV